MVYTWPAVMVTGPAAGELMLAPTPVVVCVARSVAPSAMVSANWSVAVKRLPPSFFCSVREDAVDPQLARSLAMKPFFDSVPVSAPVVGLTLANVVAVTSVVFLASHRLPVLS